MNDSAVPTPEPPGCGHSASTAAETGPPEPSAAQAAAAVLALWEHVEVRANTADVTPAAWRVLTALERLAPLTPGELCQALGMTAASASRLCGRLEGTGLLRRQPHEMDRRSSVLALTPAGHRVVDARREDLLRVVLPRLAGPDRRHEALRAALGALRRGLRGRLRIGLEG